jgi:2-oxoglutarate ferredoxin oxidoreductase subunit gamma
MPGGRYEIRFSGSGGQGIILSAIILAEAVTLAGKKQVCQSQSYGPEARGGSSMADVVVSDEPIDYPKAMGLDLLLAMNQASCDAYWGRIKPEGILLVDATLVEQIPYPRSMAIPFTRIARKELGKEMAANMVALGAVGQISRVVSLKVLEAALVARVPPATAELNRKALRLGIRAAQKVRIESLPDEVPREVEV